MTVSARLAILCGFLILLCHEVIISRFSQEQNSGCSCRRAFIHYFGLHQVSGRTEKLQPLRVLGGSMHMLRTCEKLQGEVGIIYFLGGSWVDWIGGVRTGMPNCLCMFFKVRPGVLGPYPICEVN